MGGLAVLHPQVFLRDHLPHSPHHRATAHTGAKSRRHANPNPNPNPGPNPNHTRSNRRKRSPEKDKKKTDDCRSSRNGQTPGYNLLAKNPVMGQVKILKRGEEMTALENRGHQGKATEKSGDSDDMVVQSSTVQLCAEPEPVIKPPPSYLPLPAAFYAGSAFYSSPPPSSLPVPGFFSKKSVLDTNDDASTDLRRLLRLDLL